jgi:hypothetical protein
VSSWAVEFTGLRLLTWPYALEGSMGAKRFGIRAVLAAAATGTVAADVVAMNVWTAVIAIVPVGDNARRRYRLGDL